VHPQRPIGPRADPPAPMEEVAVMKAIPELLDLVIAVLQILSILVLAYGVYLATREIDA